MDTGQGAVEEKLIQVKAKRRGHLSLSRIEPGSVSMSTESAVFLGAIVLAFVVFGAVLAWVDVYANRDRYSNRPAE